MFKKIVHTQLHFLSLNIAWTISSLMLLPVYIHYFAPAEYGMIAILMVIIALGTFISTGNLQTGYTAYYFDVSHKNKLGQLHEILKIAWQCISGYLLFGGFLIIQFNLFIDLTISPRLLFLALLIAALKSIQSIYNVYLQHEKKTTLYTKANGLIVIISFVMQLLFLIIFDWGIYSILIALLIAQLAGLLYCRASLEQPSYTYKLVKKPLFIYSISLIPLFFLEWLMTKGDRIFVEQYFDLEQTGIYALTFNIAFLQATIGTSYFNAARPEFFSFLKKQKKLSSIFYSNIFFGLILILLVSNIMLYYIILNLDILTNNDKYLEVKEYIGLALVTTSIHVLIRFLRQVFICFKEVKTQITFSLINAIFFGVFIYLLHPFKSIETIITAALIANSIVFISMSFYIGTIKKTLLG